MKRVIVATSEEVCVDELSVNETIFVVDKGGLLVGLVAWHDNKSIIKCGGRGVLHGRTFLTRKECMKQLVEEGYTFYTGVRIEDFKQ